MGKGEYLKDIYERLGIISDLPKKLKDNIRDNELVKLDLSEILPPNELPKSIFDELVSLEELSLHRNRLISLPDGIFNELGGLRILYIGENKISTLPQGIFDELYNLEELYLHGNQLLSLPEGIFELLGNLKILNLDFNLLPDLPVNIFDQLTKLEILGLNNNLLSTLPDDIFNNLSNLEELGLSDNNLSSIPYGFFDKMPKLMTLRLKGNLVSTAIDGINYDINITNSRVEVEGFIYRLKKFKREKLRGLRVAEEVERAQKTAMEAEEQRVIALLTNIVKIIQQITPNIQVQLTRIVELCNGDKFEVENLLKTILANNPDLGQFLEFEQVFVRKEVSLTDDQVLSSISKITTSRFGSGEGLQICPMCKETQSTLIRECTNCKTSLPFCNLCKRGFAQTRTQLQCPSCEHPYHRNHLYAYIQSKGECPVCKEGLTLNQFE